jgi:hypothetical protein
VVGNFKRRNLMLAKKHDPFIDLKEKPSELAGSPVTTSAEKPKPRGPVIYLRKIKLPISEEDLNTSLLAEVKITPREIRITKTNGEEDVSYDLEITGIRFKG